MCGIFGSFGVGHKIIDRDFHASLQHRGPDDNGYFTSEQHKITLGHTRLSIIDLSSAGHQPMLCEATGNAIVFNGEIYNYKELRTSLQQASLTFRTNTDTEVILKAYCHFGPQFVSKLRGMFSLCIFDRNKKEILLARDRLGIKPLAYAITNKTLTFCSEVRPLAITLASPRKLSTEALHEYFRFGSIQQPRTAFNNIFTLEPGHTLTFSPTNGATATRYYNHITAARSTPPKKTYSSAVKEVRRALEDATLCHMTSDVPVASFLSGGIDSNAVTAIMRAQTGVKVDTFCIGHTSRNEVDDDLATAQVAAKHLNCNHHSIVIDDNYISGIFEDFINSLDQPSCDGINTYIISKEVSATHKVALSGLGGDEVFAGYPHFAAILNRRPQRRLIDHAGRIIHRLRPNRFTLTCALAGTTPESALDYYRSINTTPGKTVLRNINPTRGSEVIDNTLSEVQRISSAEINGYLLNTLLRDCDNLSMRHSLEVRPVLLDHKLVELAFSLNDNYKVRGLQLKAVLLDSVRDLLHQDVLNKKKTGFVLPLKHWMNGALNSFINDKLHKKDLTYSGLNSRYLARLKSRAQTRRLKNADWMSIVFLLWADRNGAYA